MRNHPIPSAPIAGLSLAALLALTACGDSADDSGSEEQSTGEDQAAASSEHIYEFEQAKTVGDPEAYYPPAGEPVTIQLSNELAALVDGNRPVAVQSYELSVRAFETGVCALDAEVTYEDGGEQVAEQIIEHASGDAGSGHRFHRVFTDGYSSEQVDAVPADDELVDGEIYVTSDLSHMTVVDECSESSDDDFVTLRFRGSDSEEASNFATVEVAVHSDESVVVFDPHVSEAEVSVNGEWVADD